MAQLNDLLVAGPSSLFGPTTINGTLTINGPVIIEGEVLTDTFMKKAEAEAKFITATLSGNTLTITIP